jgi:hypothetical protein
VLRERVDAAGHRAAVAVDRRRHHAHLDERLDVGRGDLRQGEAVHPVGDLARAGEGVLHRVLLVEEHADEQGERVVVEQLVGGRVAGQVQFAQHAVILTQLPSPGDGR